MADEDRLNRVARALCVADGRDPDEVVKVGTEAMPIDRGMSFQQDVHGPAWTTYTSEARRMVAAMIAVGVLEL